MWGVATSCVDPILGTARSLPASSPPSSIYVNLLRSLRRSGLQHFFLLTALDADVFLNYRQIRRPLIRRIRVLLERAADSLCPVQVAQGLLYQGATLIWRDLPYV